jgi:hypothetical protein
MAGYTFPHDTYNGGTISMSEFEALVHADGPDGVIGSTPTDQAPVYADGTTRQLWLRGGRYIRLRGRMFYTGLTDTAYPVSANSSGSNRTDLLVARLTRATQLITIEVKAGTTALTQDMTSFDTGVFEIPLATAVVANAASAIPAGNVTSKAWFVNEEGAILCTTGTRPPHAAGRRCYETVSSGGLTIVREILSDGTTWWGGDWTTLTYNAGFTTNTAIGEALGYRRNLDGAVELRGVVKKTDNSAFAAGSSTNISTVPAALRPTFDRHHVQVVQFGASGMPAAKLQVTGTTGVVSVTANSDVSFTWVNFAEFRYHLF